MVKHYDNIEDVKSKLAGTIIYYNGIPVLVRAVYQDEMDETEFHLNISASLTSRNKLTVKLSDPGLNLTKFNIGYCNFSIGAVWWYRQPLRQYRQGLKGEQMKYRVSEKTPDVGYGFESSKDIEAMLLGQYPKIPDIEKMLKDKVRPAVAFHKDLALSWDTIHKDMVIEHKGRLIGCMSSNMKGLIQLSDEYEHLTENLKEIMGAH